MLTELSMHHIFKVIYDAFKYGLISSRYSLMGFQLLTITFIFSIIVALKINFSYWFSIISTSYSKRFSISLIFLRFLSLVWKTLLHIISDNYFFVDFFLFSVSLVSFHHHTHSGTQLKGRGEASPALFWKLKKMPWFW